MSSELDKLELEQNLRKSVSEFEHSVDALLEKVQHTEDEVKTVLHIPSVLEKKALAVYEKKPWLILGVAALTTGLLAFWIHQRNSRD